MNKLLIFTAALFSAAVLTGEDLLPPDITQKLPQVEKYLKNLPPDELQGKKLKTGIVNSGNVPRLQVNGELTLPMMMMPSPRVRFEEAALACQDFSAAGVRIFSNILWQSPRNYNFSRTYGNWWLGEDKYDFTVVDNMVKSILAVNPNALFFPRIKLDPQPWWIKANPEEMRIPRNSTKADSYVSMASEKWRRSYERMLKALITHMENAPYSSHILGYHIAAGHGGEWLYPGADGRGDVSRPALEGFRKYLQKSLNNDVEKLRRICGGKDVNFDTVEIPVDYLYNRDICRDASTADGLIIEYTYFLSECLNSNILNAARLVKELTGRQKLVIVFGGYSLRGSAVSGGDFYPVLASPDIDIIAGPAVYNARNVGDAGSFQAPATASIRLHGKLYIDESDIRTCFCTNKKLVYRAKTLGDSAELMKRHFGYTLTQDCGNWWFLLAGNNTFHHEKLIGLTAGMTKIGNDALKLKKERHAEVAVFSSDAGKIYSEDFRFAGGELRRNMYEQTLPRLGVPLDHYVLEDMANPALPDYKVYIFLNAFHMTPAIRQAVDEKIKKAGRTAIWFYAPDYAGRNGLQPEAVGKMAGMQIKCEVSDKPMPLCKQGHVTVFCRSLFHVTDPQAEVLATKEGKAILARKKTGAYTGIYSLLALDENMFRRLLRESGVHIYTDSNDVFSGNDRYLMLHTSTAGIKNISLPGLYRVKEVFRDTSFSAPTDRISEKMESGETRIYRIEPAGR